MGILAGKLWLLLFSTLMLMPMLYNNIKSEGRTLGVHAIAIISVFFTILMRVIVVSVSCFNFDYINPYIFVLIWQLSILVAMVAVFYLVLNELKEKFLRYSNTNDWRYVVPGLFEAALLVLFNFHSMLLDDKREVIDAATSISLYFIVNFYVIVGAWLCYKSYLYNLDFDIKYIARKHFFYYLVLGVALFVQQMVFDDVEVGFSLAAFLFFNYMTRSRTLISQDPLSGVNNRVSFSKYINNVFISREHSGAYIVFIDIDHFKQINDTYGHIEGDEAISLVGKTLKSIAGEHNAFVARMGGDEFVLITQTQNEEDVQRIIQSISFELEERLIFSDKKYEVSVSCGYVYAKPNSKNIKELVSKADKQMYKEKLKKKGSPSDAVV
ncbi:MAG: GGDEF domain-containing protein [Succinivibrio sp.]|nr:GGDEF domain-containing protein [Succinivibrio sp.]